MFPELLHDFQVFERVLLGALFLRSFVGVKNVPHDVAGGVLPFALSKWCFHQAFEFLVILCQVFDELLLGYFRVEWILIRVFVVAEPEQVNCAGGLVQNQVAS